MNLIRIPSYSESSLIRSPDTVVASKRRPSSPTPTSHASRTIASSVFISLSTQPKRSISRVGLVSGVHSKHQCTLEKEAVAVLRSPESVEKSFEAEVLQHFLEWLALLGQVRQARAYGCGDVSGHVIASSAGAAER